VSTLAKLIGATGVLFGLAVLGTLGWGWVEGPAAVARGIEAARPWLALWRLTLYALLVGGWGYAVDRIAAAKGWQPEYTAWVRRRRWRIAAWLVILELVLVQNVVGQFLGGLLT